MKLIDWLLRAAPAEADPAPDIPGTTPELPRQDADETEAAVSVEADGTVILDDIFTAIDYRDSEGSFSRRRITMHRLESGPRVAFLQAYCHERQAPRTFRTDRIECFITRDGEVIEPDEYWRRIGVDQTGLSPPKPEIEPRALLKKFRSAISVLVTLSRADGEMHPGEVRAILSYINDEALEAGLKCDSESIAKLENIIRSMRPTRRTLQKHYLRTRKFYDRRWRRFVRAINEVILADGHIDIGESEMVEQMERWALEEDEWIAQERGDNEPVTFEITADIDDLLSERLLRITRSCR